MDLYLPLGHILALQLIILGGYGVYVWQFYSEFEVRRYDSSQDTFWAKCTNDGPLCNLTLDTLERYDDDKIDDLIKKAESFFLDLETDNQTSQQIWDSLGSFNRSYRRIEHIVWSESKTIPPYVDFRAENVVYSFKTIRRKVSKITLRTEFDSLEKCISTSVSKAQNMNMSRYAQRRCAVSVFVLNFAKAFLNDNDLARGKGAVCYLDSWSYVCCKTNDKNQKFECSSYNPWMLGIFYTTLIITAVAFWCFPALFIGFPEEKDSFETISANTQASNPLYRAANCVAQTIRRYSVEYYFINVIRKLLIGLVLPMFFYIDWGLVHIITDYKIKQKGLVSLSGDIHSELNNPLVMTTLIYGAVLMVISLLPRTDSPDFLLSTAYYQKMIEHKRSLILNARNETGLDLMKSSWSLIRTLFIQFSFGFKGWADGRISLCWRIINFVFSCVLIVIVFPVIAVYILIGYCLYILPLGRQISILFCYADIYFYWSAWRLTRFRKSPEKCRSTYDNGGTPNNVLLTVVRVTGLLIILVLITLFLFQIIISSSLKVFSNLIIYLYIGLLNSNDELLPIISLISIFVLYMWDSCSSVGNKYKNLLEITFDECKLQEEGKRVVTYDQDGKPKIRRLSDLFQKICDEIQPFRKEYTVMCLKMAMIALFLSLTYCCISVFGKTRISKLTDALTVALSGLIPKFVQIFSRKTSDRLINMEKAYRIKKIVQDFFTEEKEAPEAGRGEEEISSDAEKFKESSINRPDSSKRSSECDVQQLNVNVDINPAKLKSTGEEPVS